MHDFRKSMLNASICKCARFSRVFAIISSADMLLHKYVVCNYKSSSWAQSHIWLGIIENYHEVDISIPCILEGDLELGPFLPLNDESSPTQFLRKTVTFSRAICSSVTATSYWGQIIWLAVWLDAESSPNGSWCQANILYVLINNNAWCVLTWLA